MYIEIYGIWLQANRCMMWETIYSHKLEYAHMMCDILLNIHIHKRLPNQQRERCLTHFVRPKEKVVHPLAPNPNPFPQPSDNGQTGVHVQCMLYQAIMNTSAFGFHRSKDNGNIPPTRTVCA